MLEPSGLFSLCRQYRLRTVFTRSNGRIHAHGSHRSSPKSLVYHFDRLTSDVYLGMKQSIQPLHHTILITRVYVNDYCESRMGVSLIKKGDFVQLTMSLSSLLNLSTWDGLRDERERRSCVEENVAGVTIRTMQSDQMDRSSGKLPLL